MSDGGGSSSHSQEEKLSSPVKTEPLSQAQQDELEYLAFCGKVTEKVRYFQDLQVQNQATMSHLISLPFTNDLQAEVKKQGTRLAAIVKLLLRASTEQVDKTEYKKCEKAMLTIETREENIRKPCERHGVKFKSTKATQNKRRKIDG